MPTKEEFAMAFELEKPTGKKLLEKIIGASLTPETDVFSIPCCSVSLANKYRVFVKRSYPFQALVRRIVYVDDHQEIRDFAYLDINVRGS